MFIVELFLTFVCFWLDMIHYLSLHSIDPISITLGRLTGMPSFRVSACGRLAPKSMAGSGRSSIGSKSRHPVAGTSAGVIRPKLAGLEVALAVSSGAFDTLAVRLSSR